MTHMMRRFPVSAVVSVLVFLMLGGSAVVFSQEENSADNPQPAQQTDVQTNAQPDVQADAGPETMETLRERNNELTKLYGELKTDRDNLLAQSQRLREENKTFADIKANYDQFAEERQLLLDHKETSDGKIKSLEQNFEALKMHMSQLSQERNDLQARLTGEHENREENISRLKAELEVEYKDMIDKMSPLKKENKELKAELEKSRKEFAKLEQSASKGEQDMALLKEQVAQLGKRNQELVQENMNTVEEARSFPAKFTELAAQNQRLIDETADMHYNLGVFYVNNKEYKRAVQEFEKTLELRPNDADTHYNLGYIYAEHLIDRPKAIQYFKKYLLFAPDAHDADWVNKYLLTWQTWYGQGSIK